MNMNKYLDIAPEVQQALAGRPPGRRAREHDHLPRHALSEKRRDGSARRARPCASNGAVPATIAILGGRLKAGLSKEEITYLGKAGRKVAKVSRRDLRSSARAARTAPPPSPRR